MSTHGENGIINNTLKKQEISIRRPFAGPSGKEEQSMETMGNLRRTRYCGEVSLADAGSELVVAGSVA